MRIGRGFTGREHSRGGSPYSPSTGLRFFADAVSGAGITTLSRVRHRDPASAHGTAFREGIAAKRREVGVFQRERFFCETGDRGGGCSVPLPVSPSPTGRYPMDTVSGDLAVSSRSHLTPPPKILPQPRARPPGQSPINCPPPCRGRGEARNAPGGGGVPAKTVQRLTQETGEGDVPPPPPRGDSPWIQCRERRPLLRGLT